MEHADALAEAMGSTEELLTRYLEGFDEDHAATQAPGLPNHAAWTMGHLALTMHRAAERIGGRTHPLAWDPEPFAFGSTPSAQRGDYPPLSEMIDHYRRSMSLLQEAVRSAGDGGLDKQVRWGRGGTTAGHLAMRMIFHNGVHCGQLVDLRRALGMEPVIR